MDFICPLCKQPVSRSLYNEITGIWKDRERMLGKIRDQRKALAKRMAEFEKRKISSIRKAVQTQTKTLERRVHSLQRKQQQTEKRASIRLRALMLEAQKTKLSDRQRLIKRMREQDAALRRKMNLERKKMRKEAARLKAEKAHSVQLAIQRQTKRFEVQSKALELKEARIETEALNKIKKATEIARMRAERTGERRLRSLKEQLDASVKEQLERERRRLQGDSKRIRERYLRASESYKNTLAELRAKDHELLEQARHFNSVKKELRLSMKNRLSKEREQSAERIRRKYERLGHTFRHTLAQMTLKDKALREQASQIRELRKQLERQTTPQLEGLLFEGTLIRELKKRFPDDKFDHPGKGGDVVHRIMHDEDQIGIIVYECKRVRHYSASHVKQTATAKTKRNADFAILVTNAMKRGTHGFFSEKSVLIVHATGVIPLVCILREQVLRIGQLKLGQSERRKAVKMVLEYIEGADFSNSIDAIVQESIGLVTEMKEEVKKHVTTWKKRYDSYGRICAEAFTIRDTATTLLSGESGRKDLVPREILPDLPALPEFREADLDTSPSHTVNSQDVSKLSTHTEHAAAGSNSSSSG